MAGQHRPPLTDAAPGPVRKDGPVQILVLGEALIDVVERAGATTEHVGGSCLNAACGLARLGHPTALACWIGADEHGRLVADHLSAAGVALVPGSDAAPRTPVARATLDAAGAATYTFDLASDLPAPAGLDTYCHLHTGSLAAAIEPGTAKIAAVLAERREHATVSFDPNVRPALAGPRDEARAQVERFVALADVVKASDEDLAWLYPGVSDTDAARAWLRLGPALVVVTRGASGAVALLAGEGAGAGESPGGHVVPARASTVVDTVGAGDSFLTGLVSGLLDAGLLGSAAARERLRAATWAEIEPALNRAAATASSTVAHAGAYAPTRAELPG